MLWILLIICVLDWERASPVMVSFELKLAGSVGSGSNIEVSRVRMMSYCSPGVPPLSAGLLGTDTEPLQLGRIVYESRKSP